MRSCSIERFFCNLFESLKQLYLAKQEIEGCAVLCRMCQKGEKVDFVHLLIKQASFLFLFFLFHLLMQLSQCLFSPLSVL